MDEESTPSPEPEDVNDMDYIPSQLDHAGAASGRTQLGSTSLATPLKSPPVGDYADKLVSGNEIIRRCVSCRPILSIAHHREVFLK